MDSPKRNSLRVWTVALISTFVFALGCQTPKQQSANANPWNLQQLHQPPNVSWSIKSNLIQQLYYDGEPLQGKPTRVFAYLGRPNDNKKRHPGIVLVHGGGGKAFKDWAQHWAQRGYVALAMDLSGNGPDGRRLPDGGPDQSDTNKFRNFTPPDIKEMWTYHAVADVIRAHSLLASLPEVDADRIALTGISWGGYLTCIVAGLDHRFKAAVPVYGCGYLGENSAWKDGSLAKMTPEARALWLATFDPSQYLAQTRCPILFLNGTHDFAYPLDSYQKSYRLVRPELRHTSVVMKLPHGHIWTFPEVDQFIDRTLAHKPFPEIGPLKTDGAKVTAKSTHELKTAELNYTTNVGPWQNRQWRTIPAKITGKKIQADLPNTKPITYIITATTPDNLRISSEYSQR
jgi:dienelactone hydrolase